MNDESNPNMSALELGMINSIAALALALKASPGFNNEALKKLAQHSSFEERFCDKILEACHSLSLLACHYILKCVFQVLNCLFSNGTVKQAFLCIASHFTRHQRAIQKYP